MLFCILKLEKKEREKKRRKCKKKIFWMRLKHGIKNVYFVFKLELMLLLLINCAPEMLIMEKKGSVKDRLCFKEKKDTLEEERRETNE